ncbi:hypothetical protein D3C73_1578170 [compost metagenome]
MTTVTATFMIVVNVNMLYLKALSSSNGLLLLNWLMVNKISESIPVIMVVMTSVLDQPIAPALLNPYNKVPNPSVDKIIPVTFSLG